MRRLPPLAAVRAFEAAARHGHFTRAAAELGMTQAAVSYQIRLLEERLGVALFARAGRGMVLTEAGARIAPDVTRAFEGMDKAFGSVRDEADTVLTISAPTSFAVNWLSSRLGAFQMSRPGLAVRLQVDDAIIDFAAAGADVAIRAGIPPWPGLHRHFLMRMAIVPFASPALIAAQRPVRDPADVLAMPRLPDDQWWPHWSYAAGLAPPCEVPGGVRFDSQVLVGNSALAGHGVALLTPLYWQPQIASGQLVRLSPVTAFWHTGFWLVYPEARRGVAKVRAFRDWMMAEMTAAAGADPDGVLVAPAD